MLQNFEPHPTLLRIHPKFRLEATGDCVSIDGGAGVPVILADAVLANTQHFLRKSMPQVVEMMGRGDVAAVVHHTIDNKPAWLTLSPAEWALGEAERCRYAAWSQACVEAATARGKAEREFDLLNNESGEGYNPHRSGAGRSYAKGHEDNTPATKVDWSPEMS